MSFGSPWLLLTLVALPLLVAGYVLIDRRRRRRVERWTSPALLPNLVEPRSERLRHIPPVLLLLALTFLLVGFARPRQNLGTVKGAAPVVVLDFDVSGSMASTDLGTSRLLAARELARSLVQALPAGDRVAVVSFAVDVRLLVSPTFDRGTALAALPKTITPRSGTRIGDGIEQGLSVAVEAGGKGYPGDPQKPGVVVLFSDGGETGGGPTPLSAANTAYLDGIPIDAVALGTAGGTVVQTETVLDQVVSTTYRVPVFAPAMKAIAQTAGGTFVPVGSAAALTGAASALRALAEDLAPATLAGQRTHELSSASAAVAIALFLAAVLLSALWYGRVT